MIYFRIFIQVDADNLANFSIGNNYILRGPWKLEPLIAFSAYIGTFDNTYCVLNDFTDFLSLARFSVSLSFPKIPILPTLIVGLTVRHK